MAVSQKRAYFIFVIVGLALLMSSIDSTIVAVGLPTLMIDLKTNLALAAWAITGYQFSQSIIMPIAGKLSDEWGRKKLFLAAVILFTASSIAAGLSQNIIQLVIFRVLQGIGGGTFLPSATGIISDAFGNRRAQFIGLFGSIFPIGGIIGPNLGGFIIEHFSWQWIFFVNVPIGVLLLICGAIILPEKDMSQTSSNRRIDFTGLGLFVGAVFAVLYGITNWANHPGGIGIITSALFILGAVMFVLFFRYEDRIEQPMIDTKLLRWRPFLAVNIYNFLFGAVIFGLVSYLPYYATIAYGMSAEQDGLLLTPRSIMAIIVSAITSIFIIRFRYRSPMIIGLALIILSLLLLSRGYHDVNIFGLGFHNLLLLSLIVAISGIGMGIANPASNNAALDLMPEKVAAVTGMRGMFRAVGGMFGTASVTLILSFFTNKPAGMQYIFGGFAILLAATIPIVFLIPDTAHERRTKLKTAS
ncbi:MAG: DHA2 family efflux MFS transporter permease subunit [Dehalococcoidales bacterium]|nr:DHA2 family efflux MFS transporter permease subunit [Dehalococcoidales bacterium]